MQVCVPVTVNPPNIRDQIWHAVDPTGQNRTLINAAIHGGNTPDFLRRIGADLSSTWAQLTLVGIEYRRSIEAIEVAIRILGPRGWSVTNMDQSALERAIQAVGAGDEEAADDLLADQWDGDAAWRLTRICGRVSVMGSGDQELHRLFRQRARLLELARDHHLAGRYDASIPLLQAQMEGIVIDVTAGQKRFFTKGTQKADLVDPSQLVSIEACLAALQATYGQDVKETQTNGSLSRHGVLHGRELAYDTRANSAKTWSVLDALVEWALPKARQVVEARKAERQARNAGSQETDERGRRVDDREFPETRSALRLLGTSAMGWHRQHGRFRADLVDGVYDTSDFAKRGLPALHGIQQHLRSDDREVMYWRETPSGWVLGLALTAEGEQFGEHLYSAAEPPRGLPSEDTDGWGTPFATPPDWT